MTKTVRKIVIVGDELNTLGGVQKFIESLSLHFVERGFDVALIGRFHSTSPIKYNRNNLSETIIFNGRLGKLLQERKKETNEVSEASRITEQIDGILAEGRARLSRIIEAWDSNTIVITTQIGSLMELFDCGLKPGTINSPKIIAQYHGTYEYAVKQSYISLIDDLFPKCDISLFLTQEDTAQFKSRGIENAETMVNGIERVEVDYLSRIQKLNVVVSMGRYAAEKSLDELLEAWAMVSDEFPEWRLELYGSGPEEDNLREQILRLGIENSTYLRGLAASVRETFARSKINIMSSHKEGFPVSLLEAAACGVPSVAYNAGPSTKKLIADGVTGYITSRNTPKSLAVNLRSLMSNSDLRDRMSGAAYESSERYELTKIMNDWVSLVNSITNHKSEQIETQNIDKIHGQKNTVSKSERMVLDMKYSFILRNQTDSVSIAYRPPLRNLEEKAFAFKITLYDIDDNEIDPKSTSLHYSETLDGGFIYSPKSKTTDFVTLPMIKSSAHIGRIHVTPTIWGLRNAKSKPVITELFCESSVEVGKELWYRLEMPIEVATHGTDG